MKILFLCVANSARSQIAEGLAKVILGDAHIESAGSAPAERVHFLAVKVLEEIGVDISQQKPKHIDDLPKDFIQGLDLIVTLCKEEQCPVLPGNVKKESWSLPDPVQASVPIEVEIENFRTTRDSIATKIERLKAMLEAN